MKCFLVVVIFTILIVADVLLENITSFAYYILALYKRALVTVLG